MSSEEATEQFYAALLDNDPAALYERAPCGYVSCTPEGTIIQANQTFLTLNGYDRQEVVGRRTFASLLTGGGRIYHETHYAPMLQMHGMAREIALDVVRADGTRLPALVNSVLERNDDGAPVVIRTAVFDATERRSYERELVRAKERAEASEARARLLSQTLQGTLIPPAPPVIPGLDIATVYRPAGSGDEVGGDFYDVFEIGDDDWVVTIGDVLGKGVEAAIVTALARHTIRASCVRLTSPADVLGDLNKVLLHHPTDRFCTVTVLRLRRADGHWTVTVSCGGHPFPFVLHQNGTVTAVGRAGSLIGALDEVHHHDVTTELVPGASLVLYTDGVTEARGTERFFGEAGLLRTMKEIGPGASVATLAEGILTDVVAFQDGHPRDDIAVVVLAAR